MHGLDIDTSASPAGALLAAASGHLALVREAIAKGLDVNAWYPFESSGQPSKAPLRTLCHIAAYHGCVEVLHVLLVEQGADVNASSPTDGATPLHSACEGASPRCNEVIEVLLSAGADKEATDAQGRRPVDLLLKVANAAPVSPVRTCGEHVPRQGDDGPSDLNKPEYSTDEARMYMFKVADCPNMDAHDWTDCPFAHPGEKARRRDPKVYVYTGVACPDFRKGACKRGDVCPFAHGVFECWLHPSRYRTQLCKDAPNCDRRVCFFAHQLDELRTPATADSELLAACLAMSGGNADAAAGGDASSEDASQAGDALNAFCAATCRSASSPGDSPTAASAATSVASSCAGSPSIVRVSSSCSSGSSLGASAAAAVVPPRPTGRSLTAKERALAAVAGTAPYKPNPKLAALLAFGGGSQGDLLELLNATSAAAGSSKNSSSGGSTEKSPVATHKRGANKVEGSILGDANSKAAGKAVSKQQQPLHHHQQQHHHQHAHAHPYQQRSSCSRLLQQHVYQQQQQQQQQQLVARYYANAAASAAATAAAAAHYRQALEQQVLAASLQQQHQLHLLAAAGNGSPFAAANGGWGAGAGSLPELLQAQAAAQELAALQQQHRQQLPAASGAAGRAPSLPPAYSHAMSQRSSGLSGAGSMGLTPEMLSLGGLLEAPPAAWPSSGGLDAGAAARLSQLSGGMAGLEHQHLMAAGAGSADVGEAMEHLDLCHWPMGVMPVGAN